MRYPIFNTLKSKVDKAYVYAAGLFGTIVYCDILRHGGSADGFVVTKKEQDCMKHDDKKECFVSSLFTCIRGHIERK